VDGYADPGTGDIHRQERDSLMANILRVVAQWGGFPSAPGFTNLYFDSAIVGTPSANEAAARARQLFEAMKGQFPDGVTITISPQVAEIDDATGQQQDEFTATTTGLPVPGTGVANRSAPSGACINWRTSTFVNGRRLRGRTFLVPLSTNAYQTDGTLEAGTLTVLRAAAVAYLTDAVGPSAKPVVWHRPIGGAGGSSALITASAVTDVAAILTSRR